MAVYGFTATRCCANLGRTPLQHERVMPQLQARDDTHASTGGDVERCTAFMQEPYSNMHDCERATFLYTMRLLDSS
jgi:hypothetical protein